MFRLQRTMRASRGKLQEAIRLVNEYLEYVNANYAPVHFQAYSELFGDVGTLYWFADFEELAAIEAFLARIREDEESNAFIGKGNRLFIEASGHDTLMRLL